MLAENTNCVSPELTKSGATSLGDLTGRSRYY